MGRMFTAKWWSNNAFKGAWKKTLLPSAKNYQSLKISLINCSVHVSLINIGIYWHSIPQKKKN